MTRVRFGNDDTFHEHDSNAAPMRESSISVPVDHGGSGRQEFAVAVRPRVSENARDPTPTTPYAVYTRMTDADVKAPHAYFGQSVESVDATPEGQSHWNFPFNWPGAMPTWQRLFFDARQCQQNPGCIDKWNRGAYPARFACCTTCHAPHDALLAEDTSWFLTSGRTEGLSVPNITTSDRINGG